MGLSSWLVNHPLGKVVNPEEVRYHTSYRCRLTGVDYRDLYSNIGIKQGGSALKREPLYMYQQ